MQRCCVALMFCLYFCIPAFPQKSGTVLCDPSSMTSVPAWIAPGWPYVVDQLTCGQIVRVVGQATFSPTSGYSSRPPEYVKIEVDDRVAFVDARFIGPSDVEPKPAAKKNRIVASRTQLNAEEDEQKKWGAISKDQVKLRDEVLLKPLYLNGQNGPRTFTATLSNSSNSTISHFLLLVRLYDCSDKPKSDYSNCEIIGEAKPVIAASIPPGQTRRVTGSPLFEATPAVRGIFAWGYQILGVRVE